MRHSHSHTNMESHAHHHHNHGDLKGWKIGVSIILNVIITIAQVIGGFISGSIALMTDALHNFSDVISLLISYIANRLTAKESTITKTYGYKRAEIFAAFINSATLIGVAVFLIIEAVKRFSQPIEIEADIVIWFAVGGMVINFLSVLILHKDSRDNMNIRSAYLHLLSDTLTSVAVLFGGLMIKYFNVMWVDSVLSVMIALYLIYSSYSLLIDSTKVLMQFTPKGLNLDEVNKKVCAITGINNLHHLHVWQLDDKVYMLEGHLEMAEDFKISEFQEKLNEVEEVLKEFGINHINIQPEIDRCENKDQLIVKH